MGTRLVRTGQHEGVPTPRSCGLYLIYLLVSFPLIERKKMKPQRSPKTVHSLLPLVHWTLILSMLLALLLAAVPAQAAAPTLHPQLSALPVVQQEGQAAGATAADATAGLAETTVHLQSKRATTLTTADCTKDTDDNPFNDPPCTHPPGVVIASRTHKVEDEEEDVDQIVATSAATADLVFHPLPTLPKDAVVTGATLVIAGTAYGNEIEIIARDLGVAAHPQVATTTVSHQVNISGRSPNNCYNRYHGGLYCQAEAVPVELRLELPTTLINQWYTTQNGGGQNGGLQLALPAVPDCASVVSAIVEGKLTIECSFQSENDAALFIYYDAATLSGSAIGAQAPSYDPDRFARAAHEYRVQNTNSPWLAVAAHLYANGGQSLANAETPLNLRTDFDVDRNLVFASGSAAQPVTGHAVNYAVVDNTAAPFNSTMWVELHGKLDNMPGAAYRLQRFASQSLPTPTQEGVVVAQNLPLLERFRLYDLPFAARHSLLISVTAPTALGIGLELFSPQPGIGNPPGTGHSTINQMAGAGDGRPDKTAVALPGNLSRTMITARSTSDLNQTWALALSHSGACPIGSSAICPIQMELIACPPGMYPTERWGCQSLFFPHATIFPEVGSGQAAVPATAVKDLSSGVRIFSEGGFEENPTAQDYGSNNFDYCTKDEGKGMPLLGLTSDAVPVAPGQSPPQRLIAVLQGSVCVTHDGLLEVMGTPGYGAVVGPALREATARPAQLYNGQVALHHGLLFEAFGDLAAGRGHMVSAGVTARLDPADPAADALLRPWDPVQWPGMSTLSHIAIERRAVVGVDQGVVHVITESATDQVNVPLSATWEVAGDFANFRFAFTAQSPTVPPDMAMASLLVRFHGPVQLESTMGYDNPKITELHLPSATIHQTAQMGGAYKPIQAVLLPAASNRSDGLPCAGASCLDLRNATNIDSAQWAMPDIDVSGETALLMMQAAGVLQLYSNDHPDAGQVAAAGVDAPTFSQSFNFKTFGANVSIKQEQCITADDPSYVAGQEYPKVTVIRGTTSLALPSLGDGSESGPGLVAEFKLCQTQLRQIKLTFNAYPPGIAAGPSGVLIKGLSGVVWVDPAYVRIEVGTTFQSADGATFTNGNAKLTIDTRGYFALGGGARLVGTFDLDGKLAVAWNPLDILQEANLSYRDWFTGFLRLHAWRGQGWGEPAPYPWLPANNDFHFTGTIGAIFTIEEGRIGKFFGIELPRHDLEIGVEVSFGEFCKNDACTSYEWGVQGKVTVLKFTIGVYLGKSTGVKFFIGDKGRTLIDQAFGLQAAALGAVPTAPISDLADGAALDFAGNGQAPCPLQSDNKLATCSFTIEPDTGQALITVAWAEGTMPTALLHTPDGIAISALAPTAAPLAVAGMQAWEMNAGGVVQFSLDDRGALYTIENPQPGTWQLTLGNLTGSESYNVLFAANSPAPQLMVQTPNNVAVGNSLDIQWTITPPTSTATVHLSYISAAAWLSYTQGIAAGQPLTAVAPLRSGIPIGANIPASQGSYQWQPVGLASGAYYVVARVDHPIHGSIYSFSPGSFTYVDNTPPAVPANLLLASEPGTGADGLVASWERNQEADLSAYEVLYSSPSLEAPSGFVERLLRIPASDRTMTHPTRERVRLVGLLTGVTTTVCVRAIDASGNRSACSTSVQGKPQAVALLLPPVPNLTNATAPAGDALAATWAPNPLYDGYLLAWGYGCGAVFNGPAAQQGASNLDVGNTGAYQLNQLPVGAYRVAVRGYQLENAHRATIGWIGDYSNLRTVLLTNNVDGDGDGLPDDWAQHYGVQGVGADPDGDGLNNGFEKQYMTDPTRPDSDGDGFSDGAETFAWLTQPCDPASVPDTSAAARLWVQPQAGSLRFEAVAGQPLNAVQRLRVRNSGRGQMNWQASASAPWITLSPTNGGPLRWWTDHNTVEVRIDTTGLAPGYYEGSVRIDGLTGAPVLGSPYTMPVRLWVLRNRVANKTRVTGYVFLDENGNGVEDGNETTRVADVTISLVNAMGATMTADLSKPNTGLFDFSQVPLAGYTLIATPADPALVVTTPNPLPFHVAQGQEIVTGLTIGVVSQPLAQRDSDQDGILDLTEDLNHDGNLENDDSDGDGLPNYRDPDDDNDGVLTALEGSGDSNGNGIADYLEPAVIGTGNGAQRLFLPVTFR